MKKIFPKFFLIITFLIIYTFTFKIENCKSQWVQMSNGITEQYVMTLAASGNYIFAGTANMQGVFRSTNNGITWSVTSLNYRNISSLIVNGNYIYAGADDGVYISTNYGTTWTQTGVNYGSYLSFAVSGNIIFTGTNFDGVFVSSNNGSNWFQTTLNNEAIWSLAANGYNIFAGTSNWLYISTNNGILWAKSSLNRTITSLLTIGNNIFAGTVMSGVYLSTNNGANWTQTALNNKIVYSLISSGNNIFTGIQVEYTPNDSGGVYLSTNNGISWIKKNQGFNSKLTVHSLLISNNYIYAGTSERCVWRRSLSEIIGVQNISTEIPSGFTLQQNYPNPFNPSTNIQYEIPKNGFVNLSVFNTLGREVETLVNEKQTAGTYGASFNASQYSSGVYFYRLTTNGFSETKKMLFIK